MNEQMRSSHRKTAAPLNGDANGHSENNAERSVTTLVRELANDITSIFTKEVALAKSEITHSMHEAKNGTISVISGGSVLYAGFLFLLLAAVVGLANVVELWLASLIVGGVVAIVGFAMVQAGKKKLEPASFTPRHTVNSLQKDRAAVRGATR